MSFCNNKYFLSILESTSKHIRLAKLPERKPREQILQDFEAESDIFPMHNLSSHQEIIMLKDGRDNKTFDNWA